MVRGVEVVKLVEVVSAAMRVVAEAAVTVHITAEAIFVI